MNDIESSRLVHGLVNDILSLPHIAFAHPEAPAALRLLIGGRLGPMLKGEGLVLEQNEAVLSMLRHMRLWHWKALIEHRALERVYQDKLGIGSAEKGDMHRTQGNLHLGYVQVLNNFFPMGDNAEGDFK
jgi:hypothetical protein